MLEAAPSRRRYGRCFSRSERRLVRARPTKNWAVSAKSTGNPFMSLYAHAVTTATARRTLPSALSSTSSSATISPEPTGRKGISAPIFSARWSILWPTSGKRKERKSVAAVSLLSRWMRQSPNKSRIRVKAAACRCLRIFLIGDGRQPSIAASRIAWPRNMRQWGNRSFITRSDRIWPERKSGGSCEEAARRLHRPVATLRSDVARLRFRYRALVLAELRTQTPHANLAEELRDFCRLLAAED